MRNSKCCTFRVKELIDEHIRIPTRGCLLGTLSSFCLLLNGCASETVSGVSTNVNTMGVRKLSNPESTPAEPKTVVNSERLSLNIIFVLDSSGSMAGTAGPKSKMQSAKEVLDE